MSYPNLPTPTTTARSTATGNSLFFGAEIVQTVSLNNRELANLLTRLFNHPIRVRHALQFGALALVDYEPIRYPDPEFIACTHAFFAKRVNAELWRFQKMRVWRFGDDDDAIRCRLRRQKTVVETVISSYLSQAETEFFGFWANEVIAKCETVPGFGNIDQRFFLFRWFDRFLINPFLPKLAVS